MQGIHNIFIVLPQFLVTFISAIIFYLLEPSRSALPVHHAATIPPTSNITVSSTTGDHGLSSDTDLVARWIKREAGRAGSPDSVGLIFRWEQISSGTSFSDMTESAVYAPLSLPGFAGEWDVCGHEGRVYSFAAWHHDFP